MFRISWTSCCLYTRLMLGLLLHAIGFTVTFLTQLVALIIVPLCGFHLFFIAGLVLLCSSEVIVVSLCCSWFLVAFRPVRFLAQKQALLSCFPFIRSGQNHLARHSERGKKTRRTKEEVGRQHQGMGRPGVRQVPEGSGEQGKWRKLVAKSSVVPQRPSRLRD